MWKIKKEREKRGEMHTWKYWIESTAFLRVSIHWVGRKQPRLSHMCVSWVFHDTNIFSVAWNFAFPFSLVPTRTARSFYPFKTFPVPLQECPSIPFLFSPLSLLTPELLTSLFRQSIRNQSDDFMYFFSLLYLLFSKSQSVFLFFD